MSNLTLFAPGLFSPAVAHPDFERGASERQTAKRRSGMDAAGKRRMRAFYGAGQYRDVRIEHAAGPQLPALELLLARAVRATAEGGCDCPYENVLCDLFGIQSDPDHELPIAALTHLIDFDGDHEGIWMRADPVYLRPDLSKLLLFDAAAFKLGPAEAEALLAEVNAVIGQEGWQLITGRDYTRWYLRLPQLPRIRTWPPTAAVGQHIDPYLPVGPDAGAWHRLANEVQMVLHASEVNRAREARGELPVNSVWFWGGGELPAAPKAPWSKVWSSEPVAQGLARLCDCPFAETPTSLLTLVEAQEVNGDLLVVLLQGQRLKRIEDMEGWRSYILELEQSWFVPLLSALKARKFASVTIHTGEARFTVTLYGLRRFWLWRKRIGRYV